MLLVLLTMACLPRPPGPGSWPSLGRHPGRRGAGAGGQHGLRAGRRANTVTVAGGIALVGAVLDRVGVAWTLATAAACVAAGLLADVTGRAHLAAPAAPPATAGTEAQMAMSPGIGTRVLRVPSKAELAQDDEQQTVAPAGWLEGWRSPSWGLWPFPAAGKIAPAFLAVAEGRRALVPAVPADQRCRCVVDLWMLPHIAVPPPRGCDGCRRYGLRHVRAGTPALVSPPVLRWWCPVEVGLGRLVGAERRRGLGGLFPFVRRGE